MRSTFLNFCLSFGQISPTEASYFLAREVLMTERTYKKDLDILNTWFQDEIPPENVESLQPLFQLIESMTHHHGVFLRDLEHRILMWENRNMTETPQIGDIMLKNMVVLPIYEEYLEHHRECLERLNEMYGMDDAFQQIYREFEQQKICYVPIGNLVLKPLHRLLHYQLILESEFSSLFHSFVAFRDSICHFRIAGSLSRRSAKPCRLPRGISDDFTYNGTYSTKYGRFRKFSTAL